MDATDENNPVVIRPANIHGRILTGRGNFNVGTGQNRRALSTINRNIIGAHPYPCAVKRNVFSDKHGISDKNAAVPVHRPITRKFSAQMANKQQEPTVVVKQSVQSVANATNELPVPMFVQHTEAMLQEIDRMDEEVEMQDVDEEMDIDSGDKKNPLAVVEYIDEIYADYKKSEAFSCVPPNYMAQQCDINDRMRAILIDWLIEVHYKFELMEETLYLSVNLIDRFLSVHPVMRKKLQLVGITALLLACKYEEVSVPVVEDLILISDRAYSRKEVLDMEKLMVNTLHFNMSIPTPYVFLRRFLKAAQSNKQMELLTFYIIELCLLEYGTLKFTPSLLAAAAIFTAQTTLSGLKQWSKVLEKHTTYTADQLLECSKLMVTFHQKAGNGKLTGVYRKYSTSKYGYAAKSEPAHFLLEAELGC